MTKTITKTTLAALALGMTAPAMAADGALGGTSSASMNVSLEVTANTDDYVQIIGLDDITFSNIVASPTGLGITNIGHQNTTKYLCLNKNSSGPLTLTIDKPEISHPIYSGGSISYVNEIANGENKIALILELKAPNGDYVTSNGNSFAIPAATLPESCTSTSGSGVAFGLNAFLASTTNNNPTVAGTYSNTFTLTLAAQ